MVLEKNGGPTEPTIDPKADFTELEREIPEITFQTYGTASEYVNQCKNRYSNVFPPESTRVVLKDVEGYGSDYINASHVTNEEKDKAKDEPLILTQAPLPNTFKDFWRMLWEKDVDVVLMLTKLEEKGMVKADEYWPDLDKETTHGLITVKTVYCEFETNEITHRKFVISHANEAGVKTVTHLHYTGWPDFGKPESTESAQKLIELSNTLGNGTQVLHCSAGLGRAGTFAAIKFGVHEIENNRRPNIKGIVRHIRSQRHGCVQSLDQYTFIHTFLSDYASCT
jgi:protein tyrosine phosphatase